MTKDKYKRLQKTEKKETSLTSTPLRYRGKGESLIIG